jgi:N-formylglutamate amidohydrolase
MDTFERIVLHIPHSTEITEAQLAEWDNKDLIAKDVKRWTDWETDLIFDSKDELKKRVLVIQSKYSRFVVDVERLENDPLEEIGQGIIYETSHSGARRKISQAEKSILMHYYVQHRELLNAVTSYPNTLIVDCHSFPSNIADVDVCIGFNEDETTPSDETISNIVKYFSHYNLKVGINTPYANAIVGAQGSKSVMIELNKRIYWNEQNNQRKADAYKVAAKLKWLYQKLLGIQKPPSP